MKSNLFKALIAIIITFGFMQLTTGCSDNDKDPVDPPVTPPTEDTRVYYNVVLGVGVGGDDGTLAQASTDLSKGSITFQGYGFSVPSTRTARVYASSDGKVLYNLNYGGGKVAKYNVGGGVKYAEVSELDVEYAVKTLYPRWTKVNEESALIHNIMIEHQYKDGGETYVYTKANADLASINLEGKMSIGSVSNVEIPRSEEDIEKNLYVWRIDAPVVNKGKAYYGLSKQSYNSATAATVSRTDYAATSIVVDYPSLKNPKVISSGLANGSTYGYRTPVAHVDEKGDVYQLGGSPAHILKIKNEAYDNSFVFDLSEKLGLGIKVASNGWFYVGNGIGYIPYYDIDKGNGDVAAAWGVARIDLYKGTAIKMDVPGKLWLQQYQYSVCDNDGKFLMALAPIGSEGYIYMFDPESTSPTGFTTGAKIESAAGQFYIGIF